MLDQSIRLGIMELMESLRKDYGTAFLFITHDIVLARHFCERLIVLRNGQVVEEGPADRVLQAPEHDYTRALIAAV
jgi:ABC-type microcin C transport system duplicated ATPase subunit YejF